MVADYRAFRLNTGAQPRFRTTAVLRACLKDPDTEQLVTGPVGTYTLWRNGALALDQLPLAPDAAMGPEYLRAIIAHDVLGEHGDYKWSIEVTDPATGYTGTDEGKFRL